MTDIDHTRFPTTYLQAHLSGLEQILLAEKWRQVGDRLHQKVAAVFGDGYLESLTSLGERVSAVAELPRVSKPPANPILRAWLAASQVLSDEETALEAVDLAERYPLFGALLEAAQYVADLHRRQEQILEGIEEGTITFAAIQAVYQHQLEDDREAFITFANEWLGISVKKTRRRGEQWVGRDGEYKKVNITVETWQGAEAIEAVMVVLIH